LSPARRQSTVLFSLVIGLLAFGIDRLHKALQVNWDCVALGEARCVSPLIAVIPAYPLGWRGGEIVPVTSFFDYVLVWNTGISYGLFSDLPVIGLGALMAIAIILLAIWYWRTQLLPVRTALAMIIGGALSNALDRLLYGAVADFFHFHWAEHSFYIFNLADVAISLGVLLLILDAFGINRGRKA
jgi:signal peptidase II